MKPQTVEHNCAYVVLQAVAVSCQANSIAKCGIWTSSKVVHSSYMMQNSHFKEMHSLPWCDPNERICVYDELCAKLASAISTIEDCFIMNSSFEPFGSSATGLYEAGSDVDLLLKLTTRDDVAPMSRSSRITTAVMDALLRQIEYRCRDCIRDVELQYDKNTLRFTFISRRLCLKPLHVDLCVEFFQWGKYHCMLRCGSSSSVP